MSIRVGASDVLWGYAGTFIRFGASLVVLPFALRLLPSDEMGIWYVFQTLSSLVTILDYGFANALNRNVAYSWSGVKRLTRSGVPERSDSGPNIFLLWNLIRESKRIYLYLSLMALSLTTILGSYYIYKISLNKIDFRYITIAWIVFLASLFMNLYYSYWNAFLSGLGLIKQYQKANVLSGMLYVIVAYVGLTFGFGLIALSAAMFVNGISLRTLSRRSFIRFLGSKGYSYKDYKKVKPYKGISDLLWYNAKKYSVNAFGTYLTIQFNIMFLPVFLGLSNAAIYGLCVQIMRLLIQFGNVPLNASYAEISSLRAEKRRGKLMEKISILYVLGFAIVAGGAFFVMIFGNRFLGLIQSKTMLPGVELLSVILVMMVLEWSNIFVSAVINTENKIPYMRATLLSGILIVATSFILLRFTNLGLWSVVLPQIAIQSFYNYWRWHLWMFRDLEFNYGKMFGMGMSGMAILARKYLTVFGNKMHFTGSSK
jgi:O-antigen/teichoic acid export membrane protein